MASFPFACETLNRDCHYTSDKSSRFLQESFIAQRLFRRKKNLFNVSNTSDYFTSTISTFILHVWCLFGHAEKLTFREVKTPQEFRQNEDAEVICDVISSPVPAVSWFYKNRELSSDPNSKNSTIIL